MSLNDFRLLGLQLVMPINSWSITRNRRDSFFKFRSHFGLVIFLAEIELITCQTRDQTIDFVQELVESLNQTMNYALGLKKTENYMLQNRIRLQEALQEQRALSNMKHSIKLENDNICEYRLCFCLLTRQQRSSLFSSHNNHEFTYRHVGDCWLFFDIHRYYSGHLLL